MLLPLFTTLYDTEALARKKFDIPRSVELLFSTNFNFRDFVDVDSDSWNALRHG